jgi:hypothetical protein
MQERSPRRPRHHPPPRRDRPRGEEQITNGLEENQLMSDKSDERDVEFYRAVEMFIQKAISDGFTKEEAIARLEAVVKESAVQRRRSQMKLVK